MAQKTTVFHGTNPSQLYMDALLALLDKGKDYAPRGKKIKELRPVTFEFHQPTNRVTFLKGRVINPFFQLAESLWILTGRSDVAGLTPYNKSISQFSDDGVYFNAPYGERLRYWGKNDASETVFNPIDQLKDCYEKLKADPDTRQAVAFIGNPHFDSSKYTLKGGKDIACNINIKFKIRDGALDITVDNRSNDLHWGTFGANLCQFSTIQEAMASWLGVDIGTYFQDTDSLHMYTEDYGFKETNKILDAYADEVENLDADGTIVVTDFHFPTEPRMESSYEEFEKNVGYLYTVVDPILGKESVYNDELESFDVATQVLSIINGCPDPYLRMTFQAMMIKQAHNFKSARVVVEGLNEMEDSTWKLSCLRFLYPHYKENEEFREIYKEYPAEAIDYIERKDVA